MGDAKVVLRSQPGDVVANYAWSAAKEASRATVRSAGAGPVEFRTTNSGSHTILGIQGLWSSRRFNKVRAAISPIFSSGWRTVVRLGLLCTAILMSSKPTTETSFGTCNPASWNARMDPIAEMSLYANRAVNGRLRASSFLAKG